MSSHEGELFTNDIDQTKGLLSDSKCFIELKLEVIYFY